MAQAEPQGVAPETQPKALQLSDRDIYRELSNIESGMEVNREALLKVQDRKAPGPLRGVAHGVCANPNPFPRAALDRSLPCLRL
jgi:hypothetical protein